MEVRSLNFTSSEQWSNIAIQQDQVGDSDLRKIIEAKKNNQKPTIQAISSESPITKAYWAQWNSLQLINGCLHRMWESEDGSTTRN